MGTGCLVICGTITRKLVGTVALLFLIVTNITIVMSLLTENKDPNARAKGQAGWQQPWFCWLLRTNVGGRFSAIEITGGSAHGLQCQRCHPDLFYWNFDCSFHLDLVLSILRGFKYVAEMFLKVTFLSKVLSVFLSDIVHILSGCIDFVLCATAHINLCRKMG